MTGVITDEEKKACDVLRKVSVKVEKFCAYIQSYWMRASTINQLSCYLEDKRTNNAQESWHKVLQGFIKSKNPHVGEFMGKSCYLRIDIYVTRTTRGFQTVDEPTYRHFVQVACNISYHFDGKTDTKVKFVGLNCIIVHYMRAIGRLISRKFQFAGHSRFEREILQYSYAHKQESKTKSSDC